MKVDFAFLHVDTSESLMNYTQDKLTKLERFEFKPMDIQIHYSMQKYECTVEIGILEGRRKFKATATTDDFYRAVDKAVDKLWRQMSRGKRRIKNHHNHEKSAAGRLEHLTPELEFDYTGAAARKAS